MKLRAEGTREKDVQGEAGKAEEKQVYLSVETMRNEKLRDFCAIARKKSNL